MTATHLTKLVLQQVSTLFDKLTEEQLKDLAEGRAYLEFRSEEIVVKAPKPRKATAAPMDVVAIVDEIKALSSSAEIKSYLDGRKFKQAELKAIAVALGPTVSARGTIAELKQNIAEGTQGFRERSAAIGGWGR